MSRGKSSPVQIVESKDVLLQRITALEAYISELEENVRLLKSAIFGRSSEKQRSADPISGQLCLPFENTVPTADAEATSVKSTVLEHQRRKRGRKPLPKDLPRVRNEVDLPEDQKVAPCGCCLKRIGEVVSERLCIKKAEIYIEQEVRFKYAPDCQCPTEVGAPGEVKIAPATPQIIPKGIATAELVAHVVTAKFADALPLHRQEQQFRRLGVDISRATMVNWILLSAAACQRLLELLTREVLAGPAINADETRIQVLDEPGRANTALSYMWVYRGGPTEAPGVIFRYEASRAGHIPETLLKNYHGYLQTDGYAGYQAIGERAGIRHLGCWAHVRRKFVEVIKGTKVPGKTSVAEHVLELIGKLYEIERRARHEKRDGEEIVALREGESRPLLSELKAVFDRHMKTTPPRSLLGKAIGYALGQWPRLTVYLEQGFLAPDNNLAENAIRPFAVGRKNWLFSGSPRGAHASALFFSLIETAKANEIEPNRYLRFIFTEVPIAKSDDDLRSLLPQHLDRNRLPL